MQDAVTIRAGETVELEVLSIVCARSADPGSVEITDTRTGRILSVADLLHDEGAEPDEVSRDGHWRGRWSPPAPGEWELRLAASPADVLHVLVQP